MASRSELIDIARNAKTIEWLKAELIGGVSALFKAMLKNHEEAITDSLANIVVACYLLGKRMGITFSRLDIKIENKVAVNITKGHEIEQWYGDFTALSNYLEGKVM